MSTHIKIENQTEVPILVALFEQPKCNDHPTRSAVLKPGESCDWGSGSVPLGNYQCYAVMSGDASSHDEWVWHFPGIAEVVAPLELGFKLWHQGDIDWANVKAMSSDDLNATFGSAYTSAKASRRAGTECPPAYSTFAAVLVGSRKRNKWASLGRRPLHTTECNPRR